MGVLLAKVDDAEARVRASRLDPGRVDEEALKDRRWWRGQRGRRNE
jgi:hypothetical protein